MEVSRVVEPQRLLNSLWICDSLWTVHARLALVNARWRLSSSFASFSCSVYPRLHFGTIVSLIRRSSKPSTTWLEGQLNLTTWRSSEEYNGCYGITVYTQQADRCAYEDTDGTSAGSWYVPFDHVTHLNLVLFKTWELRHRSRILSNSNTALKGNTLINARRFRPISILFDYLMCINRSLSSMVPQNIAQN